MEFHPAANLFPLDDENIDALAEDIKAHGQLCPVELLDGKILDGRRRWKACKLAGVKPETVEVSPDDPVAYVMSLNLHRRQLTPAQRSMVAAKAREYYDKQAKERKIEYGKTHGRGQEKVPVNLPEPNSDARDAAGKAMGVSGKSVDFATKVLTHGTPELIKAVEEGRMAVSTAAIYATEPPEFQREVLADPKRNRTYQSVSKPVGESGQSDEQDEAEVIESKGVGIRRAHEAIACLKRIPANDALRKRGFQVVTDWIKHNK